MALDELLAALHLLGTARRDAAATVTRAARLNDTSRDGARAAQAALAPTLSELQDSAFGLLEQMLPTVAIALPEPTHGDGVAVLA